MILDWTIIFVIPPMILSLWASNKVKSNYMKYSRVRSRRGMSGAQVAAALLSVNGIKDVKIERTKGQLTDHYDPRTKTVRLSEGIHDSSSLAALSVAAHEVGHAVQHNQNYGPLALRASLVPMANLGTSAGVWLFMIGMFMASFAQSPFGSGIMLIGILMFAAAVAFQLVTLPVEFNASNRAMQMLADNNFLENDEIRPAKKVLDAAALTYIAAAATAMAQLLRFVFIFMNRRRR